MSLDYRHGTSVVRVPEGTINLQVIDQATVGIIGTAPAADAAKFPLNQPVGLTGDLTQIADLGATGTLLDSVNHMIMASGGSYLPKTAIVRVDEGVDADATLANMVGAAGSLTGFHAFKAWSSELGFKPKTYMAPGFTGLRPGDAANPLIAAMSPWLETQRAMMLAACPSTTKEDAVTHRNDTGSMTVEMIDPRVMVSDPDTGLPVVAPAEPFVMGLGVRIIRNGDSESKKPAGFWVSWSNAEIGGIVDVERPMSFDYSDRDTESHFLNENQINTIVREKGWRYWGGLTASSDGDWMFSNVVRTRHAIEEMIAKDFGPVVDAPMTAPAVVNALVSLDEKLKDFKQDGAIIEGSAFFLPAENSNGAMRQGKIRIEFDAEETPPIHLLEVGSRRNKKYFDVLVDDIVRELSAV